MHGDAVKVRPGREKTKWRCCLDSIPRTGCFLCVFVHLLRTLPNEVSRSTATKVESGISNANPRSLVSERRVKKDRTLVALVSERRVKKDRTLVEKIQTVLSQLRAAEHPIQLVKKQRTGRMHRHPFERKSPSIKAKGKQSRSTGFARDFGSIVVGTKPSGRTLDLYIYIYRE